MNSDRSEGFKNLPANKYGLKQIITLEKKKYISLLHQLFSSTKLDVWNFHPGVIGNI